MDSVDDRRDGVLIIGAWIDIETNVFRARVTRTDPIDSTNQVVTYADAPAKVTEIVEEWLELFVR